MAIETNDSQGRAFRKTYRAFIACMEIAKRGKTFIFMHPNFVAIDLKTWREMQSRLNMPVITYDETSQITEKQLKEFEKLYQKKAKLYHTPLGHENMFRQEYMTEFPKENDK